MTRHSARARRRRQAHPALRRLRGLSLVPCDGARVLRGRATAALMNEHFVPRQGRPRGAPRHRLGVHGRRRFAHGPRGLADDRLSHARRRAVLRRDVLPARAAARAAELPSAVAGDRRRVARAPLRHRARRRRDHGAAPPRSRTITRAADVVAADGRRARASAAVRSRVGWVRTGAEVPAGLGARVPAPPRRARARDEDARRDGRRRHVRPRRRRLPPLLGRSSDGSCRTSRRCSTTTRCSFRCICTAGS